MDSLLKVQEKITNVSWCDDAEERLMVAARGCIDIYRHEVTTGISQLWLCESPTATAYVVTRVESLNTLCIVAGEGSGFFEFMPHFMAFARKNKMMVRTHVTRPGLVRMWEKLGLVVDEYTLKGK